MPSANLSSIPSGADAGRPPGSVIQPCGTVEDYSRIMLEYTQRRLAGFADPETEPYAPSRSSSSSNASGQSDHSPSGVLAGNPVSKPIRESYSPDSAAARSDE
ncbi:hypothetical protein BDW62DRAFT_200875 [Aspergillus aurantiobrunneus]